MPRTPGRAITHADLAPRPRGLDLGSKTGALLTILCILCGLLCFVLSLFAEATRSEVLWVLENNEYGTRKRRGEYECVYSGSGKVPLICASVAFVTLAIAVLIQHSFMFVALSKMETNFLSLETSLPIKSLTCQAAFFFFSTWVCFAVGEIMQLIGLSVESGHMSDWSTPRSNCMVIRQGVFTGAGVFSLLAVFLAAGLYATMLRVQWLCEEQDNARREVLDVSALYASPPGSPPHHQPNPTAQDPPTTVSRQNPTVQPSSMLLSLYKSALDQKQARLV